MGSKYVPWSDDILHLVVTPSEADTELTAANAMFSREYIPDSKVHGANMGPTWGWQDPCGSHVGPINFAIFDVLERKIIRILNIQTIYIYIIPESGKMFLTVRHSDWPLSELYVCTSIIHRPCKIFALIGPNETIEISYNKRYTGEQTDHIENNYQQICLPLLNTTFPEYDSVIYLAYYSGSVVSFLDIWAPFQYPIRRLIARSREASKPRDWYF